jgi:predicted P-loop ATPase
MRELRIAYGNSCFAKRWSNKTVSWDALCQRLATTMRSTETVQEYPKLPKAERDRIKDIGGFVAAELSGGRRKRECVSCRSMLTLDGDKLAPDFLESFELLNTHAAVVYSTHSHTPEAPRLRVIVPLARDVTADEYNAVARYFAAELGIDQFDECSYRPHQLMYWPSTPSNGEYVFKVYEGIWLDPDDILSQHPDWRDCSVLPTSSRESAATEHTGKRQQDPTEKEGVVGAFCRAYSIESAIETFLTEVYEPSAMAGRYDYIPADSSAGVVVYDGKWAFSHHASDPACGQLCNAFDLVRMHRFTDFDDKAGFKAMSEFAVKDDNVCAALLEEHRRCAAADFAKGDDWAKVLARSKSGKIENTLGNLLLILTYDEALAGIRFNRLANQTYGEGLPWERTHPAWRDADTAQLVAYVDSHYGDFTARNYELALTKVADDRAYHPILDYIDGLPTWDKRPRLDTLFADYLGAEDTPYTRAVTRKTLVAAVARINRPGIKFDSIPVLNGNQGIGKSTLIAKLGREWYSDSLSISDMKDKTAPEKLQGNWLLELSEMAGIKKMDVETVKSFASRIDDKYRPSYGRVVESHPRQCVIIGTTNNDGGFLRDVTGNRRFWPVRVTGNGTKRPWDLTDEEVAQVWAEALFRFNEGEELYLTGDVAALAADEQREAMENDDREGLVAAYLEALLPDNWDELDIYRRQDYFRSPDDPTRATGTVRRTQVSNIEIWCECFGRARDAIKKADSYEIEAILRSIGGWSRYNYGKTGKKHIPIYGIQRIYVREELAGRYAR